MDGFLSWYYYLIANARSSRVQNKRANERARIDVGERKAARVQYATRKWSRLCCLVQVREDAFGRIYPPWIENEETRSDACPDRFELVRTLPLSSTRKRVHIDEK
jgi:hypothetical protein